MRVALMHYHLARGGISSVLRQQARALLEAGEQVLILHGGAVGDCRPDSHDLREFEGLPLAALPSLACGAKPETGPAAEAPEDGERLAEDALAAMRAAWGGPADLLHVHNPLINRNRALLPALRILRDRGVALLLENHDFAEDFRPDLYLSGPRYIDDVHYAVVNGRDYSLLRRAGLDASGVHLLTNPVAPVAAAAAGKERRRYLYPVRALRRKNLGEALLLSLFIPKGSTVALSLPPLSSRDLPSYQRWRDLAAELSLPVEFDVGVAVPIGELLGASACAITTSVKEAFGFSFLEPWTAGREVLGRRLPSVGREFERAGLRFDGLYDSVDVPLVYLPGPLLKQRLEDSLSASYRAFGLGVPPYASKSLMDDLFSRPFFDFGRLDEELQAEVLQTLASNDAALADLAEANPFLAGLAGRTENAALIASNREKVLESYAPAAAARRLLETYAAVLATPVKQHLSKAILLELFLDPLTFSMVGNGRNA